MRLLFSFLLLSALTSSAQDKYNLVHFNKLTEIAGSNYVIATMENVGKMATANSKYLLFINTADGKTVQVDFPKDADIEKIDQIKLDSLGIHRIIVCAQTVDLDGKQGIDWNDPAQIFVLSVDGQERKQLTEDGFFVRTWLVNKQTGRMVITGHYDSNRNGKKDTMDRNQILIYDLKTLKLVNKI
ncbi:hypothetical protein [Pedobacter heparinus]|uniref:hypothetical protein n=1 Tax=Pedobacter heparinus TaxID=984 RepID=UPI00292E678E|nr:hypothetical protein [Pedobacter heparinus]